MSSSIGENSGLPGQKSRFKETWLFFRQIDGQRLLLLNFLDFICILNGYECALAKFFMIKVIKVHERGPKEALRSG